MDRIVFLAPVDLDIPGHFVHKSDAPSNYLPHLLISFDQIAVDMDDGARWYREIYEIFDVTLVPPRQFICHDLAPYHEPKPDSPDQVFEYKDFLSYLGVLQTLPLDTLQLLEKQL
ncbi:uncharacterized protein Dsimw501_GD25668 [Drosophila simulans]|uniref:DUF4734 domain-containing protein n=2 Tax=Drosophila simulans TaxID=7240 RepID=A0A0J9U226_DROSI|nr:uncharacterized protein Dsimw501_GD25668 [Drosophila simulans]